MMSPLKSVGHWHLNTTPLYLLYSSYIAQSDHGAYVYTPSIILIILVINGIITHAVAHLALGSGHSPFR